MSEATPTELRAPDGARRMEIDWSDGVSTAFHHQILRGFCPCAHCQGHHGPVAWVEPDEHTDLSLDAVEPVGHYAVQLAWGDGHNTGIYTFRFLRALAEFGEASPAEVRGRVFER